MEVYKDRRLIYDDDDDDIDASRIKTSTNALIQNTKMPKKKLTPQFHHRLQLNKFQSKHLHVLQVNKGCGNTYVFGQIENYPIPQP